MESRTLISDVQWHSVRAVADQVPRAKVGRKPADDRQVLEAFLWVVFNGRRWQDLPGHFPSARTCQRRLQQWRERDIWSEIWRQYLLHTEPAERVNWARALIAAGFDEATVNQADPPAGSRRVGRPPWWIELARDFWAMARNGQLSGVDVDLLHREQSTPSPSNPAPHSAGPRLTGAWQTNAHYGLRPARTMDHGADRQVAG